MNRNKIVLAVFIALSIMMSVLISIQIGVMTNNYPEGDYSVHQQLKDNSCSKYITNDESKKCD